MAEMARDLTQSQSGDERELSTFGEEAAPERASSTGLKLQADGKGSDAAIRRLISSENQTTGDNDATTAKASVGDSGMLTKEMKVAVGGSEVTLQQGTYVVVKEVKGADLVCQVWSGLGGKLATIPGANFKAEPALSHKSEPGVTDQPRDYVYKGYTSVLWDGAPKAADVAQGRLADCYLIAAMGAVAAANPKAIMDLFDSHAPNQTSYTISLYVDDGTGNLKKHPIVVDTNLPTKLEEVQQQSPTYALMGKSFSDHRTPIWPALLEKAYAQLMGGFDVMGDKGGYSDAAMEALTGVAKRYERMPRNEAETLAKFKTFQKDGKAVVCGTLGSKQAKSQGGFTAQGEGGYHAALMSDQGLPASIVPGSLKVYDKKDSSKRARDDSNGKLAGGGFSGSVAYSRGTVDMKAEGSDKPKAEDLLADYEWRGQLDKKINLYAWHAYIFEKVTDDGKLQFKNPWGSQHPAPMTAADFLRLFSGINVNDVTEKDTNS